MILTEWLAAASVLVVGVVMCGLAAWRRAPFEALVAWNWPAPSSPWCSSA